MPIRAFWGRNVCGPAFITIGADDGNISEAERLRRDKVRVEMLEEFPEGGIQVLKANSQIPVAHYGDLTAKCLLKSGGKGAIVEGATRDADILADMQFPMMCLGTHPQDSIGFWSLINFGLPIEINGVHISNKMIIHMGNDGACVFPTSLLKDVVKVAKEEQRREARIRAELDTMSPMEVYTKNGRW